MDQRRRFSRPLAAALAAGALVLALTAAGLAQAPVPVPPQRGGRGGINPDAMLRGRDVFQTCAACHGAEGRGGARGGIDLMASAIVTADPTGHALAEFLRVGRPEKGMPAFPLSEAQAADVIAFVRSRSTPGASTMLPTSAVLVGNSAAGKAYFEGRGGCAKCHSPIGDLKGIGSKYDARTLQNRMVLVRTRSFSRNEPDGKTVTVTPVSGPAVTGQLLRISDFKVVLVDSNGVTQTIDRDGPVPTVTVTDRLQAHVDMLRKYTDGDIHNLTAYLVTLK